MRPTLRCVLLFAGGIPVASLPVILGERLWTLWIAYLGLCVAACGLDLLLGLPRRRLAVAAQAPDTLYIGDRAELEVSLEAPRRAGAVEVLADLDEDLERQPVFRVGVAAGTTRFGIPLVARRRGTVSVRDLWLRWSGPLGLVARQKRHRLDLALAVVPNIKAVRLAALRFFAAREFMSGLKVERYVGDGSEFESLREYVPGLDHRAMNWKASARHRKLICEEFRAERNHFVVLALDSGHLMSDPLDGIPKLDHAINAGLLLTYVCLRTGDRVGWFTFDEQVRGFAEPEGGMRAFLRLQRQSAEIEYSTGETNFTLGLMELSTRLRRRTLVIVLSDFVDTVSAELMLENLERLSRRHMILFVTLRDPHLDEVVGAHPGNLDAVYRSNVAADFVREREVVIRKLKRLGVHCLDVAPGQVTTDLLNRYLDIKRRELF